MKEQFEQFIVQSKQFLLESEYHEKADKISFVCQIVSDWLYDNSLLGVLMSCGIMTKPDANNEIFIIPMLQDFEPITLDEFKQLMSDYSQDNRPDLHIELIIPNAYYDFLFKPNGKDITLQEAFELLDISKKENDWNWAVSGGIGFRIVQDVVS